MKKLLLPLPLLLVLMFPATTRAANSPVIISEIQVSGTSANDEFAKLTNVTNETVDLTGWRLQKKTASGTTSILVNTFPATSLSAGETITIAPQDYSGKTDIRYTSHETLADNNTVVLTDAKKQIIDLVGYGLARFSESVAALNPAKGQQLQRQMKNGTPVDTNNNASDFILVGELTKTQATLPAAPQSSKTKAALKKVPKDSNVIATGIVVATPGTARPLSFYINNTTSETDDVSAALRIDIASDSLPTLALGDRVSITGRYYGKRLEPTITAKQVAVLGHENIPTPTPVEALPKNYPSGLLVNTAGTILSKYAHGFLLKREAQLTLRVGYPLDVSVAYPAGTAVELTGIFINTAEGHRLLIRASDDITVKLPDQKSVDSETVSASAIVGRPFWLNSALVVTGLGTAVGLYVFFRQRKQKHLSEELPFEIIDDE